MRTAGYATVAESKVKGILGHDLTPAEFSSGVGPGQAVTVLPSLGVRIETMGSPRG